MQVSGDTYTLQIMSNFVQDSCFNRQSKSLQNLSSHSISLSSFEDTAVQIINRETSDSKQRQVNLLFRQRQLIIKQASLNRQQFEIATKQQKLLKWAQILQLKQIDLINRSREDRVHTRVVEEELIMERTNISKKMNIISLKQDYLHSLKEFLIRNIDQVQRFKGFLNNKKEQVRKLKEYYVKREQELQERQQQIEDIFNEYVRSLTRQMQNLSTLCQRCSNCPICISTIISNDKIDPLLCDHYMHSQCLRKQMKKVKSAFIVK